MAWNDRRELQRRPTLHGRVERRRPRYALHRVDRARRISGSSVGERRGERDGALAHRLAAARKVCGAPSRVAQLGTDHVGVGGAQVVVARVGEHLLDEALQLLVRDALLLRLARARAVGALRQHAKRHVDVLARAGQQLVQLVLQIPAVIVAAVREECSLVLLDELR
eukprot:5221040-Pleurochrysis_carterae.AAC.1